MRSFFKKPAWASADNSSQGAAFYKRSDKIYPDIVASERENSDKKSSQKGIKTEEPGPASPPEVKRRRISGSDEEDTRVDDDAPNSCPTISETVKPEKLPPSREQSPPAPQSPSESRVSTSPKKQKAISPDPTGAVSPNIIDVDDESPKPQPARPPSAESPKATINISDDDEEEDIDVEEVEEEFPELARKARERARRAAESQPRVSSSDQAASAQQQWPGAQSPQTTEPRVEILITSELENTNPLVVYRKITQNLKDVRAFWCRRQGFSPDMTASVFLTWKGKRLFDVTTCESLGVDVAERDDDLFESNGDGETIRVHMEAMTEELFKAQKRSAAMPFADDEDEADSEGENEDSEQFFRVILQGPDIKTFRMKVRPKSQIVDAVQILRNVNSIPPSKAVHLLFDGERLDPNSAIVDNDIADLDCIDVVIK